MKIFKILFFILLALLLIGAAGYLYASSGVKSKPGYVSFNALPTTDNGELIEAMIAINVGPNGVAPMRWVIEKMADQADRVLQTSERVLLSVLQELQGVQLRIYEIRNNRRYIDRAIANSTAELSQNSWQPLVKVRDGEEYLVVMQFGNEQQITAISVMASTPENAVFLNLIGPFNPAAIAATAKQLH